MSTNFFVAKRCKTRKTFDTNFTNGHKLFWVGPRCGAASDDQQVVPTNQNSHYRQDLQFQSLQLGSDE
jgi:transcription initiation factor IIE alpha subunit